jgi:hypothetical protein
LGAAIREEFTRTKRPLVIDDFHFVDRAIQRQIVRVLKPLVLAGVPVMFVAISHRVQDVVTAEPDMTGRVVSLPVPFWSPFELEFIANKGFNELRLIDSGGDLARRLAAESYGSPHLMQRFCRELCKENGIRTRPIDPVTLRAPARWDDFFRAQIDEASGSWFQRLLRGPQERGRPRATWTLRDGRQLDNYGLALAAIAETGPKFAISKDELKAAIDRLVVGTAPPVDRTTRVLIHMTRIAAKRSTEPVPTEEDLERDEEYESEAQPDIQPVLEYIDQDAASVLHIADPFFAFYLRWGSAAHLSGASVTAQPD